MSGYLFTSSGGCFILARRLQVVSENLYVWLMLCPWRGASIYIAFESSKRSKRAGPTKLLYGNGLRCSAYPL